MSKRLFVGNVAREVTDQELGDAFAAYGTICKAEVVRGRGGRGRGFGYVELASDESAARAIAEMHGQELRGQTVTVGEARASAPRSRMEEADQRTAFFRGPSSRGGRPGGYRR